jgi:hypothetical protein
MRLILLGIHSKFQLLIIFSCKVCLLKLVGQSLPIVQALTSGKILQNVVKYTKILIFKIEAQNTYNKGLRKKQHAPPPKQLNALYRRCAPAALITPCLPPPAFLHFLSFAATRDG